MKNDELKERLISVLQEGAARGGIRRTCSYEKKRYGTILFTVMQDVTEVEIDFGVFADALIAAGLRFGENLTATFDHMALEREHDLERRLAEAEKEIEEYKRKIEYGKLVEPVWFISFMNDLPCYGRVIGYQEDSGFVMQCSDCMISAKKIYLSEEEAEKELNKESKD